MRRAALLAGVGLALLAPAGARADCGGTKHFSPHKRLVHGRQPLAIGDSVMLGAGKQLSAAGFEVDVRGCRQVSEGLSIMARRRANRTLPRIVIMALGANFRVTSSDIHRALRIVGRKRLLGLVTPRHANGAVESDAALIRAAARHHPGRIKVLDWVRYSAGHPGWFGGDGLHLGPAGAAALTRLLLRVVPRVHPRRGAWSGSGRTGPVGFSVRGGVLRNAVLVVNKACLGTRRIELRRSARAAIPVSGDGAFAVSVGGGKRSIGLRGRFKRRNRVTGFLRVRMRGCDSGRIRWTGRPGRPKRRGGGWKGADEARQPDLVLPARRPPQPRLVAPPRAARDPRVALPGSGRPVLAAAGGADPRRPLHRAPPAARQVAHRGKRPLPQRQPRAGHLAPLGSRRLRIRDRRLERAPVTVVRSPLRVRPASSRTLDERISLRFPALADIGFRLLTRLPPTSRIRQAALSRAMRMAIEAYNRGDLEAASRGFHPDLEYYPYKEFVEAALAEPCYHGPAGYRAYITATYDVWGGQGVRLEPTELIDMGDRLVLLADMPMRAQASGVSLSERYAAVMKIKDGKVIEQRDFLDQAEALELAGLGPG